MEINQSTIGLGRPMIRNNSRKIFAAFVLISIGMTFLFMLPSPYDLLPFVIIGGVAFLFASIKYPMAAGVIYMLFYFVRPQELFPGVAIFSFPYERIVAIMLLLVIIIEYAFKGKKIRILDMDKGVVVVMAAAFLSIMTSLWISWAWQNFSNFFKIAIAYFFLSRIVDTELKLKWTVWIYMIAMGFIAVSSAINFYMGNFQETMGIQRAVGMGEGGAYGDPNTMATTLLLSMPFLFFIGKSYRNWAVRIFLIMIFLACLWTIIITGSRGGMLGAGFTIMLIAWNTRHKAVATLAAVLLIIAGLAVMPDQYMDRLKTIFHTDARFDESGAAESARGRIQGLKVGLEILVSRPIGAGIGCFAIYNGQHHGHNLNAHNLLGQIMGELGMLGILAFGFFVYLLYKHTKYIRRLYNKFNWDKDFNYYMALSIKIAIFALFFQGLFGHNAFRFNWYIYAFFLAVIVDFIKPRITGEEESKTQESPSEPEKRLKPQKVAV